MFLRTWRFITLILAALTMGTAYAHALELPAKMNYDATLWATINQSLYWSFGHIGGLIEGMTVFLAAPILTFLVRKRQPVFQWALTGTICFALAFFAVFLVSLFADAFNQECPLAHQGFTQHRWWDNQRGWKNLLNNLRLVIEPWIAYKRLKRWLEVFDIPELVDGFSQLIEQMQQFYCPVVDDLLLHRILFNSAYMMEEG